MGILASITKLDRRFGWSFLGFVLAAVFGAMSLYTEFWKETTPRLEFEVLSNAPVLDVREKLPDLEVIYQSQDIAKSGKTLSVLLIRAVNRGTADILSTYYDGKSPVSLRIEGGSLIRANLADTSNSYLSEAARISADESSITFEPVILERDEWFIIKLLVLHNIASKPSVFANGKIAGMRNIPVVLSSPALEKEGFWLKAFSGNAWTQLVRVPVYFLGTILTFILIMLGIVLPVALISEGIRERKRKNLVERFKAKTKLPISDSDEFIFQGFINGGIHYVQKLTNSVADHDRLQRRVTRYLDEKDSRESDSEFVHPENIVISRVSSNVHHADQSVPMINPQELIKHVFIKETEGQWAPVPERLKVATSFIEFIELVGASNI
jgi:hypothetical protein